MNVFVKTIESLDLGILPEDQLAAFLANFGIEEYIVYQLNDADFQYLYGLSEIGAFHMDQTTLNEIHKRLSKYTLA